MRHVFVFCQNKVLIYCFTLSRKSGPAWEPNGGHWRSLVGFKLDWTCTNSSSGDPPTLSSIFLIAANVEHSHLKVVFSVSYAAPDPSWVSFNAALVQLHSCRVAIQHKALCTLTKHVVLACPTKLAQPYIWAKHASRERNDSYWSQVQSLCLASLLEKNVQLENFQIQQWTVLADCCHMPAARPWITSPCSTLSCVWPTVSLHCWKLPQASKASPFYLIVPS